jgi:hypothetical protein
MISSSETSVNYSTDWELYLLFAPRWLLLWLTLRPQRWCTNFLRNVGKLPDKNERYIRCSLHRGCLFLVFNSEDGGSTFLRNVGKLPDQNERYIACSLHRGCLFLVLHSEDGGSTFLRNVGKLVPDQSERFAFCLLLAGSLLGLLFYPEDGGKKLLWKVDELLQNYTVWRPRSSTLRPPWLSQTQWIFRLCYI